MSDLIRRLRGKCKILHQCVDMRREAADEIERLTTEYSECIELLKDANEILLSASYIAGREGLQTNWSAFRSRVHKFLNRVSGRE